MMIKPDIPFDMYKSPNELVCIIPLWGVEKETLQISLQDNKLIVRGVRKKVWLAPQFSVLQEKCYRWPVKLTIDLPHHIIYDKIHSKLTKENILHIVLPQYGTPDTIPITVEHP